MAACSSSGDEIDRLVRIDLRRLPGTSLALALTRSPPPPPPPPPPLSPPVPAPPPTSPPREALWDTDEVASTACNGMGAWATDQEPPSIDGLGGAAIPSAAGSPVMVPIGRRPIHPPTTSTGGGTDAAAAAAAAEAVAAAASAAAAAADASATPTSAAARAACHSRTRLTPAARDSADRSDAASEGGAAGTTTAGTGAMMGTDGDTGSSPCNTGVAEGVAAVAAADASSWVVRGSTVTWVGAFPLGEPSSSTADKGPPNASSAPAGTYRAFSWERRPLRGCGASSPP